MQGLEPMDSFEDLIHIIVRLRLHFGRIEDIVIYTGYTEEELEKSGYLNVLRHYKNIIVKFGRYISNQEKHFDEVLGVMLASDNQYARVLDER